MTTKKYDMGLFERYLTLWVFICIVIGITVGAYFPAVFHGIAGIEMAHINLPVAILIWLMIIPMLLKVDLKALTGVTQHWRGVSVTLLVNWGIKPFSMALLGWLFIGYLFRDWLPEDQIDSYIAGLIILAAAPCTAMVFVWSHLMRGEPHFTLTQVALNDIIMVFAFAPIVGGLLGLSAITVPWDTLLLSVALYIIVPLIVATLWRSHLLNRGTDREQNQARLATVIRRIQPLSLSALLLTLVLLFAFQGQQILDQPLVILLLSVPILLQVFFNSGIAYLLNRRLRTPHCVAGPSALIGASNFFELAVATAIALFGFESGAALATVVGVLIEVPIMLIAVNVVNNTRAWYECRDGVPSYEQCCPTDTPIDTARS
jgi:ACR3 family arsenite transporter